MGLALLLSSAAQAAAPAGALAGQSRATIQISISVAPRVHVAESAGEQLASREPGKTGPFVAAGIRYDIVRSPADGADGRSRQAPRTPELLLVVPD